MDIWGSSHQLTARQVFEYLIIFIHSGNLAQTAGMLAMAMPMRILVFTALFPKDTTNIANPVHGGKWTVLFPRT